MAAVATATMRHAPALKAMRGESRGEPLPSFRAMVASLSRGVLVDIVTRRSAARDPGKQARRMSGRVALDTITRPVIRADVDDGDGVSASSTRLAGIFISDPDSRLFDVCIISPT
jgi:hypothetical protein